jgi:hypothetical protein
LDKELAQRANMRTFIDHPRDCPDENRSPFWLVYFDVNSYADSGQFRNGSGKRLVFWISEQDGSIGDEYVHC